mmetsp:Transcript_15748/g.23055  ORF Transcript_15748/g.23055 Transcript_15748/m.23055 type:complete len:80 (-) Transcript_15748:353-592(-)
MVVMVNDGHVYVSWRVPYGHTAVAAPPPWDCIARGSILAYELLPEHHGWMDELQGKASIQPPWVEERGTRWEGRTRVCL